MSRNHYKIGLSIVAGLLICQFTFSQKFANNWFFENFRLEFQNNTVKIHNDFYNNQGRGIGSISDEKGNLLMYSDVQRVWNRNHELMPNGDSINHLIDLSFIIPKPGSDSDHSGEKGNG